MQGQVTLNTNTQTLRNRVWELIGSCTFLPRYDPEKPRKIKTISGDLEEDPTHILPYKKQECWPSDHNGDTH
jgi:hypothetical protein